MAGSYYDKTITKRILDIETSDTADDSVLDNFGDVSNQHIDNILKQHDERIPLSGGAILNDIKLAACFYVAAMFKGRNRDFEGAKHWQDMFESTINGIVQEQSIEGNSYISHRFDGRERGFLDEFKLWF